MTINVKWMYVVASLLMAGCQIPAAMIATSVGAMPAYELAPEPDYDAPPQKIYSIDKDRFFTSENYERCSFGHVYYNDTANNIKTRLGHALATFPGHLLLDGNPNFLVFPTSPANGIGRCGNDKGCSLIVYYSLDGGRTFDFFHPRYLSDDLKEAYEKAKHITATLKGNQLYLGDESYATTYRLHRSIMGGAELVEGGLKGVPQVRTPSAQDHITCDDSIRPKEIRK